MTQAIDLSPFCISLATACAATMASFFLGLLAAKFLYGAQGSLRAWIDGILTLPLVLPPTVVGFALLLIFGRRGMIGQLLERIGVQIVFSWPATVIAATAVAFPLMYRTTLGAFEQVNPNLLDAARTLGASERTIFLRVLLPLAGPGVVAGTVLAFARALGEFGATLMLAGNIPGRTQTMPIAIYSAMEGGDMRVASLWAALIVALSMVIIRLLNRQRRTNQFRRRRAGHSAAQAEPTPLERQPAASSVSNGSEPVAAAVMEIDFEKKLEEFTLQVDFRAGCGAVGLLGASGAGKSMTLRVIAGIAAPDSGRITLNGQPIYDSRQRVNLSAARRRIGVVFQDYALFPHLTVEENVGFGLGKMPARERRARVQQLLRQVRIADLSARYPRQISGGERQRVAIARALAVAPAALLLDEPFAALDPHLRRQTEEQLRETLTSFNGVVIFVTHDMDEAFRFCNELLVLDRGRAVAWGPRHQLFENPRTVVAAQLTGCKNITPARRAAERQIEVPVWNCTLQAAGPVPFGLTHLGMRSHQILFQQTEGENIFPCWLISTSETPHEMTLYLRLHAAPQPSDPPHLQADIPKELWRTLRLEPQPWRLQLDPARLLLLEE